MGEGELIVLELIYSSKLKSIHYISYVIGYKFRIPPNGYFPSSLIIKVNNNNINFTKELQISSNKLYIVLIVYIIKYGKQDWK